VVLIQILLPTTGTRSPLTDDVFAKTRAELVEAFKGVTAYLRSPAQGMWTSPEGEREQDTVVMVEVVTERFDRAWWRAYTKQLAERFAQEEIHLRALPIEMLD
jgi:hypothetical protein